MQARLAASPGVQLFEEAAGYYGLGYTVETEARRSIFPPTPGRSASATRKRSENEQRQRIDPTARRRSNPRRRRHRRTSCASCCAARADADHRSASSCCCSSSTRCGSPTSSPRRRTTQIAQRLETAVGEGPRPAAAAAGQGGADDPARHAASRTSTSRGSAPTTTGRSCRAPARRCSPTARATTRHRAARAAGQLRRRRASRRQGRAVPEPRPAAARRRGHRGDRVVLVRLPRQGPGARAVTGRIPTASRAARSSTRATGAVLAPVPDHPGRRPSERLMTMTTCHPKFTASQRMIVYAVLAQKVPAGLPDGEAVRKMPPAVARLYDEVHS